MFSSTLKQAAWENSRIVDADPAAPDGFVVNSFANDDPIKCKDYVREKCGLPAFGSNGKQEIISPTRQVVDDATIAAALAAVKNMPTRPNSKIVKTYDYTDESVALASFG